jgi:Skp family chaperone for outer membrane proteins
MDFCKNLKSLWSGYTPYHLAAGTAMLRVMKNKALLVTLLSTAAFMVGCGKEQTASQQIDQVKTETAQAASDMKDYTFAEKDEFVKYMQGQLATLNQNLDTLSAKIDSSSDAVKAEARPKLQALRDQAAKLNQQLADDSNATASTWDSVKAGTKKAYDAMAASFADARQWASDKIAP